MWVALSELFKTVVGLFLFALTAVVALFIGLLTLTPVWIKQALCAHTEHWETSDGLTVCKKCNKKSVGHNT